MKKRLKIGISERSARRADMAITIPVWILWAFGIIGGIAVIGLAIIGVLFIVAISSGLGGLGR